MRDEKKSGQPKSKAFRVNFIETKWPELSQPKAGFQKLQDLSNRTLQNLQSIIRICENKMELEPQARDHLLAAIQKAIHHRRHHLQADAAFLVRTLQVLL